MQSSLLQTHCLFGTARGAPLRAGLGIAISRSLSGEEHCGHVGVEFVMSLSSVVAGRNGVSGPSGPGSTPAARATKKPRFAGLFMSTRVVGSSVAYPIAPDA